jgi:sugar lactone lactonase YvrE
MMTHASLFVGLACILAGASTAGPALGNAALRSDTDPVAKEQARISTVRNAMQPLSVDAHGGVYMRVDPAALDILRRTRAAHDILMPVSEHESVTLSMRRFEVVTMRTRLVRGGVEGEEPMARPNIILLRGSIAGEPGSHAFLALTGRGGGTGSITRGDGTMLRIHTHRPDTDRLADEHLVTRPGGAEWPPVDEFCKLIADGPLQLAGPGSGPGPGGELYRGPRVLTIAVDSDHAYFQLFNDEEAALCYIVQLIGAVSDIFLRDLDFHLQLGFARVWPEGGEPFTATSVAGFRNWWQKNEDMAGLNLVHLFSGRRDLAYGGVAYVATACNGNGFGISGYLNGDFPDPVRTPHLGNWDLIVVAHEIGHNLGTFHTHDGYDPPIDSCASGTEQRGTIMSYCHIRQGGLLNIDLRFHRIVSNHIRSQHPHGVPPASCLWYDCNGNGVPDDEDIAGGYSQDIDGNGIPDECEDCTGNGILNSQEIAMGAPDINHNGIPDYCETDCNSSGVPDAYEIDVGWVSDLNGNHVPDECDPDCTGSGLPDFYEILIGNEQDIDRNAVPDACQDCTGNGQPDWFDVDRQFHLFLAQLTGNVREYHGASGVRMEVYSHLAILQPVDLVFGPDRLLYVAAFGSNSVVRIDVDSGEIAAFVAPGSGGLSGPAGLAFGLNGNLFVSSFNNHSVIEYHGVTGAPVRVFISPGAGGLNQPRGLAIAPGGNIVLISSGNSRVLEFDRSTGAFVRTIADAVSGIDDPRSLVFLPDGHLLVTNHGANNVTRYFGTVYLGAFNDEYPLLNPWGIAVAPGGPGAGDVFVTRVSGNQVRVIQYDQTGRYIRSFVRGDSALTQPAGLTFRPASPNDTDGDGIPDECAAAACPADLNQDGVVDALDLLILLDAWGPCPGCPEDLNGDGEVGVLDLLLMLDAWGPCGQDMSNQFMQQ